MKLGPMYWSGNEEGFAKAVVDRCPPAVAVPARRNIATIGWRARIAYQTIDELGEAFDGTVEAIRVDPVFNLYRMHNVSEELATVATEAAERATAAATRLMEVIEKFRSATKNDLASMKATSDRVQTEVDHMVVRYNAAVNLLTAPEFERAIANAERMVQAMQAMHALQTTRVSLAIFGDADMEVRGPT